jgi:hypothetical protein
MNKGKQLSRAVIEKRLSQAWQETVEYCFSLSPTQAKQLVRGLFMKPEKKVGLKDRNDGARIFNAGLAMAMGDMGRYYIRRTKIRTEEQLAKALIELQQVREKMPAATRKAMKALSSMLPRRGGPGRQPKLNSGEASRACDHIAMFIRQKHSLKQALQMMAESSPSILGKKVGARTLQKAWDKRDRLSDE